MKIQRTLRCRNWWGHALQMFNLCQLLHQSSTRHFTKFPIRRVEMKTSYHRRWIKNRWPSVPRPSSKLFIYRHGHQQCLQWQFWNWWFLCPTFESQKTRSYGHSVDGYHLNLFLHNIRFGVRICHFIKLWAIQTKHQTATSFMMITKVDIAPKDSISH